MKLLKRLIVLSMILSIIMSAAAFAEGTDEIFARLSSLGIMIGDGNGDFRENDTLTRAEFSAIAARLMRVPDTKQASVFTDVPADHWANGYISQIYRMGVINGTGNGAFSPDDSVTYNQAVKILVGVLGYGNEAEKNGGYPSGYLGMGAMLKLSRNLEMDSEVLTRGQIAQMVYNALDAHPLTSYGTPDYVREEMTLGEILENFQDVVRLTGVITETEKTSLVSQAPSVIKGEAMLDGMFIHTETELLAGYNAEIYAREERGRYTVVSVRYPDEWNNVITADAEDAVFKNGVFTYTDENEKEKNQRVDAGAAYIYNGRKTSGYTDIENGTYTLVDNNSDRVADVVFINEPESFFVNRVSAGNGMVYFDKAVTFRGRNGIKLHTEDEEKIISLKDKDGADISIADIETGNVITIKASEDMNYIETVVSKDTIEGAIEEISEDSVVINGVRYEGAYAGGSNYITKFDLSDSGVFSLDCYGKLVGVYGGEKNTGFIYGYCIDAGTEKGISGGAKLQVISAAAPVKEVDTSSGDEVISYTFQNNDPEVYELAPKLKFDGSSCDSNDIDLSLLADSLVAIKLNADGQIKELYYDSVQGRGRTNYRFNAETMAFGGENVTRGFVTDKNTSFVLVPRTVTSLEDYMVGVTLTDKQESCRVYGTVFFKDDKYESELVQPVNVLMIKGAMDSANAPVPTLSDDVCVVGDVRASAGSIRDDAGSAVYKISVLNGTTVTEEVTPSYGQAFDVASTLRKGDLIRYKKDGFGRINSISKICSIQGLKEDYSDMIYFDNGTEVAKYGYIYSAITDTFDYYTTDFVDKIRLSYVADGGDDQLSSDLKVAKKNGPPVYLYNRVTGWIEPGDLADVVTSEYAGKDASKAFVLMEANDVKAVVIIED